jgi:hypothetical protein
MPHQKPIRIAIIVALLLLACGGTGYAYRRGWLWETAEQKKVEELEQQMAKQIAEQKSGMPRFQAFESVRKQAESLPQQYRQQFRESVGQMFRNKFEADLDAYIRMSPPERKKELDRRIKEMEAMRKEFEKRRAQTAKSGGNGMPGGAVASGAGGNGAAGSGPPSGGDRPRGDRPKGGRGIGGMLDNTSPEFRAKLGVFLKDLEQRRKELGLPAGGPIRRL